jgi:hypothetical protein
MKIIIWENILEWDKSKKGKFMLALLDLLKKNHDVKNINKKGYDKTCFESADMIVMWGSANQYSQKIQKDYTAAGIPILVLENAYSVIKNGYKRDDMVSIGWNKHCWIPEKTPRSEKYKVDFKTRTKNKGKKIILADRGHLSKWFENILPRLPKNKEIIFRPHPIRPYENLKNVKKDMSEIDWEEVFCLITDWSAIGNEAISNGVPVFCTTEASYAGISNIIDDKTDFSKPKRPTKKKVENYFKKLSSTVWKIDELEEMLDFMLKRRP